MKCPQCNQTVPEDGFHACSFPMDFNRIKKLEKLLEAANEWLVFKNGRCLCGEINPKEAECLKCRSEEKLKQAIKSCEKCGRI
jgi:hypothetical protein